MQRLKILSFADVRIGADNKPAVSIPIEDHEPLLLPLSDHYDLDATDPQPVFEFGPDCWLYRRAVYRVEGAQCVSIEELMLRIKHKVPREKRLLDRIKKEVAAFENYSEASAARRTRIPEPVRLFVWQRDEGRCVKCGSREKLEFDHIIPVADGGSNTERNVQLLCEGCNRRKGRTI